MQSKFIEMLLPTGGQISSNTHFGNTEFVGAPKKVTGHFEDIYAIKLLFLLKWVDT